MARGGKEIDSRYQATETELQEESKVCDNEGKACDAIVRLIEERTGEERRDIRLPEKDLRGPRVDLRLKIGDKEYAIEHTKIQTFRDEKKSRKKSGQISKGLALDYLGCLVREVLCDKLPGPALYDIFISYAEKLDRSKSEKVHERLEQWAQEKAPHLYEEARRKEIGQKQSLIKEELCGFQYEISMRCLIPKGSSSGEKSGKVKLGRYVSEEKELEELRVCSLSQSLKDKLPKLLDCKEEGARTVLVLESDTDSLSDANSVAKALDILREKFNGNTSLPDEIYLVDILGGANDWYVWPMKYDNKFRLLEGCPDWLDWPEHIRLRVDELIDLTG